MSRLLLSLSVLSLIAVGCDDTNKNTSQAYEQKSNSKPVVSVVPIIDNTKNSYEWNLSDELSSSLYYRFAQQDTLFLEKASAVRAKTRKLAEGQNPFGPDITWVKKAFQGDDFVVFLELVEHEEVYKQNKKKPVDNSETSADLNMSMRVRVFDVRDNEPKVILQELIHDSHFIPRPFTEANFYQVAWGHESFSVSPIGLAHAQFVKEIATRLEDYILMAKKD
ncbi:MAG: hypothetical protein HYX67_08040 [Candidatus Melainabacteria bacterium]|nr:hypothetical protein [Candidatus Melainabacteria bacterium]